MTVLTRITQKKRAFMLVGLAVGIYLAVAWSMTGGPAFNDQTATTGAHTAVQPDVVTGEDAKADDPASAGIEAGEAEIAAEPQLSADRAMGTLAPTSSVPVDEGESPQFGQYIIQNGELRILLEDASGLDEAMETVQSIARTRGGWVITTDMGGTDDRSRASLTIKVRASGFTKAMAALADIGEVQYRSAGAQDVTTEVVDINSRLRHAQAVEARLLALLSEAEGVTETLTIQDRLDEVTRQIEVDKGRLAWLNGASAMSTITVALFVDAAAKPETDEDRFGIMQALEDAAENFVDQAAAIIIWFAGALPGLALMLVAFLIGRRIYRKRAARDDEVATVEGRGESA